MPVYRQPGPPGPAGRAGVSGKRARGISTAMDRELAATEDRLGWIFGSSRSGSTWLLRMLSDLEGVVPIDDPHLGHHLGVWRPIPLAWAACEEPARAHAPCSTSRREEPGYFFAERYRDGWWEPLRELIAPRFEAQAARPVETPSGRRPSSSRSPAPTSRRSSPSSSPPRR